VKRKKGREVAKERGGALWQRGQVTDGTRGDKLLLERTGEHLGPGQVNVWGLVGKKNVKRGKRFKD